MNAAMNPPGLDVGWRNAYDALASEARRLAADARPLLTGFAACVDKRIDLHAAAPSLRDAPDGRAFYDEVMRRAKAGRGGEVLIDWPGGPKFLDPFAIPGSTAVGGTSAQAAWTLGLLGAPVIMALNDRSAEQLAVVHRDVKLVGEGGALISAGDVRPVGAGKPAHYIVEYIAGRALPDFTPHRSTRIIVRFADEDIEYDTLFDGYAGALAAGAGAGLFSSPNAVDNVRLPRGLELMARVGAAWNATGLLVHLELGEYPAPGSLDMTLRQLRGAVTSIGLNFNELSSIGVNASALEEGLIRFAERQELSRVVVHADPWALAVTRNDPERELDALAVGCLLASARAEAGRPVSSPSAPETATFSTAPRPPISERPEKGWRVACCASPFLRAPTSTVGLCDTFTAGTMLVHSAARAPALLANLQGLRRFGADGGRLAEGPS
jgi:ADP-specific Phosphofructokinase/Glucokinase conserved region